MHCHHKTYVRFGAEEIDDLEALCELCHSKIHRRRLGAHSRMAPKKQEKQRKKGKPKKKRPPCAWCGNQYDKAKHEAICVKFGLTKKAWAA